MRHLLAGLLAVAGILGTSFPAFAWQSGGTLVAHNHTKPTDGGRLSNLTVLGTSSATISMGAPIGIFPNLQTGQLTASALNAPGSFNLLSSGTIVGAQISFLKLSSATWYRLDYSGWRAGSNPWLLQINCAGSNNGPLIQQSILNGANSNHPGYVLPGAGNTAGVEFGSIYLHEANGFISGYLIDVSSQTGNPAEQLISFWSANPTSISSVTFGAVTGAAVADSWAALYVQSSATFSGSGGGSIVVTSTVSTDATMTGDGSSGSPLHVVSASSAPQHTDATITGDGTSAHPLHAVSSGGGASFISSQTYTAASAFSAGLSASGMNDCIAAGTWNTTDGSAQLTFDGNTTGAYTWRGISNGTSSGLSQFSSSGQTAFQFNYTTGGQLISHAHSFYIHFSYNATAGATELAGHQESSYLENTASSYGETEASLYYTASPTPGYFTITATAGTMTGRVDCH